MLCYCTHRHVAVTAECKLLNKPDSLRLQYHICIRITVHVFHPLTAVTYFLFPLLMGAPSLIPVKGRLHVRKGKLRRVTQNLRLIFGLYSGYALT